MDKNKNKISYSGVYGIIIISLVLSYLSYGLNTKGVAASSGAKEITFDRNVVSDPPLSADNPCLLESVVCPNEKVFEISAYNTVPEQTDSSPCIAASGDNICGRNDVVACSRQYKLGTKFVINGKTYTCLDRLASKYDHRIDVSFDKDLQGAKNWGVKQLQVIILD
jgi:3D (Asp-Asp-Asp) domain-containing protein